MGSLQTTVIVYYYVPVLLRVVAGNNPGIYFTGHNLLYAIFNNLYSNASQQLAPNPATLAISFYR